MFGCPVSSSWAKNHKRCAGEGAFISSLDFRWCPSTFSRMTCSVSTIRPALLVTRSNFQVLSMSRLSLELAKSEDVTLCYSWKGHKALLQLRCSHSFFRVKKKLSKKKEGSWVRNSPWRNHRIILRQQLLSASESLTFSCVPRDSVITRWNVMYSYVLYGGRANR